MHRPLPAVERAPTPGRELSLCFDGFVGLSAELLAGTGRAKLRSNMRSIFFGYSQKGRIIYNYRV